MKVEMNLIFLFVVLSGSFEFNKDSALKTASKRSPFPPFKKGKLKFRFEF